MKLQLPTADSTAEGEASSAAAEPADMGIWMLNAYVDEFDLPTDKYFIVNKNAFSGKFSNSATTDSELKAYVFCEKMDNNVEYIDIRLFEYGDYRVNNVFSTTRYYDVVMMDNDGTKYYLVGMIYPESSDVCIMDESAVDIIITALQKGGTVRFAITEQNNALTKYIFTIDDASGFDAAYDAWWLI